MHVHVNLDAQPGLKHKAQLGFEAILRRLN